MPNKIADEIDEKMDEVIMYLKKIDRRDKVRMWGGLFRGIITIIPTLIFIWSMWYFYENGDDILRKVSTIAAEQATAITQQHGGDLLEKLMGAPDGTVKNTEGVPEVIKLLFPGSGGE
ncbi:hypothetical protein HN512_04450 [Candidatus Peregrinibacteria bacterium]|jgi:hypothetical protein|nr:hypothetical protein [Candidatus Peregrinibacteria bacterium]MBT3599057.1 hypothetical protein [Candidatus Peregrinibacteria bacterium]MBT4585263.1 hypothetical protein [Candidatus Peregrinibacteria bacterium]MBT6730637.1 hypothetical protein [Candidatus Peregrinibacteria bacterium]MBT7009805.1 hypothetical protein [Candidatus Peregrinibacteria bacterium]